MVKKDKDIKKEVVPVKEATPVVAEDAIPEGKRWVWRHGQKVLEDA